MTQENLTSSGRDEFNHTPPLRLEGPQGAQATFGLHGAQLLSWTPSACATERLFLSGASRYGDGQSIRGGIPVIFPQFANRGPLPKHGLARTRSWTLLGQAPACARLELRDDVYTRAMWPQAFRLLLDVALSERALTVSLRVENPGHSAFEFTAALHTYLRVADIAQVRLHGLGGGLYLDATRDFAACRQDEAELRFGPELDRVYPDAPRELRVDDGQCRTLVHSDGFADAVIWNPGATKAAALDDMEPGGERRMLCVEAAQVQRAIRLAPGEYWQGSQTLIAAD